MMMPQWGCSAHFCISLSAAVDQRGDFPSISICSQSCRILSVSKISLTIGLAGTHLGSQDENASFMDRVVEFTCNFGS
jgi:hypothetical protein